MKKYIDCAQFLEDDDHADDDEEEDEDGNDGTKVI